MIFGKVVKKSGSFICKDCGKTIDSGYAIYKTKESLQQKIALGKMRCAVCFADALTKTLKDEYQVRVLLVKKNVEDVNVDTEN